jgi:hypothetical protein
MAELSRRARTFIDLSATYRFREAENVLRGVESHDSIALPGVTQRDLEGMFATHALEGGVLWPPAPLDALFLLEAVALLQPIFFLAMGDWSTGMLWGLYIGAKVPPDLSDAGSMRGYPLFDRRRNLADVKYHVFERPVGETQRSCVPALASLQADIEVALELGRGQRAAETESHLVGLDYWLGEWREGVIAFDAFMFWMTRSGLLRFVPAFKNYGPDLQALRDRVRSVIFRFAKGGALGWTKPAEGSPRRWIPMLESAGRLKGFFLDGPQRKRAKARTTHRYDEETDKPAADVEQDDNWVGPDPGDRPSPSAIVRTLADQLLDAVVPAPRVSAPDAYYEAKKRARLIQAPDVGARGLPKSASLERRPVSRRSSKDDPYPARPDKAPSFYLYPAHPKAVVRALTERVRDWTVAALLDESARPDVSLGELDGEGDDGDPIAAEERMPRNRPITTSRSAEEGSRVLATGVENYVLASAAGKVCGGLGAKARALLDGAGTHRLKAKGETPLTGAERRARTRVRQAVKSRVALEAEEVSFDVETVRLLEERRGGNPPRPIPPLYLTACLNTPTLRVAPADWNKPASLIVKDRVRHIEATPPGCWLYQRGSAGQDVLRWAWRLVYGGIPNATKKRQCKVQQICGDDRCLNPDHLSLEGGGTRSGAPTKDGATRQRGTSTYDPMLVKVRALRKVLYNRRRYEPGAQFCAYRNVANAGARVGAVEIIHDAPRAPEQKLSHITKRLLDHADVRAPSRRRAWWERGLRGNASGGVSETGGDGQGGGRAEDRPRQRGEDERKPRVAPGGKRIGRALTETENTAGRGGEANTTPRGTQHGPLRRRRKP